MGRYLSKSQFRLLKKLAAAPSATGFESALTEGVAVREFESFMPGDWQIRRFTGSASVVLDTMPNASRDVLTVMFVGHADKIRLQVRKIGDDGKIWVNTDSFMPAAIIGHRFNLMVEDVNRPGTYKFLRDLTAQAVGAIHLAEQDVRSGKKGIEAKQIYLETGLYGKNRKKQLEELGVKPGQPALFAREIDRGPTKGTFQGAYLDDSLGCLTIIETAREYAEYCHQTAAMEKKWPIRFLFALASHEEIGLYGSRMLAAQLQPNVIIGVDVNHDYDAAPGITDRKMYNLTMGEGCTLTNGATHNYELVSLMHAVAVEANVTVQDDFNGQMTGNDSMSAALTGVDAATCSIGFPIRNMHTSSELGADCDTVEAIQLMSRFCEYLIEDEYDCGRFSVDTPSRITFDDSLMIEPVPGTDTK
jgi:putative aminopeptidase FrvX